MQLQQLGCTLNIVGKPGFAQYFSEATCHELKLAPFPNTVLGNKLIWPQLVGAFVKKHRPPASPAILHGLSNINLPIIGQSSSIKYVLTIHDLIPLLVGAKGVSALLYWQSRWLLPKLIRRADQIVCVSQWTADCVADYFPNARTKLVVIANGVEPYIGRTRPTSDDGSVRLLAVARFEAYKRLDWLFAVTRSGPFRLQLITNAVGQAYARQHADDLLQSGQLDLLSQVSEAAKIACYQQADLLIHPSLYEGFCLPASEALACGVPVLYQSGSGIDEVVGGDVGQPMPATATVQEWADAAVHLKLRSQKLDFQQKVQMHLATKNSWKDAASRFKSLYQSL